MKTSIDEGTGYWFSDGYGDYMRHFQRGMASVPEWAPPNEDHLLGSTSVIRSIHYGEHEISYITFDKHSREVLRLRRQPLAVLAGKASLLRVKALHHDRQGYSVEEMAAGGFVLRIQHKQANTITIRQ